MKDMLFRMFMADDGAGSGGGDKSNPAGDAIKDAFDKVLSNELSPEDLATLEKESGKKDLKPEEKIETEEKKPTGGTPKADEEEGKTNEEKAEAELKAVEAKLFGKSDKPEDELKRVLKEKDASSKEGVRLYKLVKGYEELHKKQGLEVVIEDGIPTGLVAKKNAKGEDIKELTVSDLPEEILEALDSDPEKAVKHIWDKAVSALSRATANKEIVKPISEERKALAIQSLAEEVELDGEKSYPNIEKTAEQCVRFINAPKAPKALKSLYNANPELAIKLIDSFINSQKTASAQMLEREKVRNEKVKAKPPLEQSSQSAPVEEVSDYESNMGKAIAGANI